MVSASGQRCITNAEHTTQPTKKTVQVEETRTTVDEVRYEVSYTVRVAPFTARIRIAPYTETVRVAPFTAQVRIAPYTETVRVAPFTAQVRIAPYTETVRVAPFTETITQTYTRRQRYCAQYDTEFGTGCIRWSYRNVTETVTETVDAYNYERRDVYHYETVDAYNYEKRDVYHYETVDAYNYEKRDVYHYETVDAYNYETRTRWECCKSVTREETVMVDRVVRTCPSTYALDTNTNHCKRPAGTDLGSGSPVCPDSTWILNSTDRSCSRILPGVVRYGCHEGDTEISPATTPPTCRTYTCPTDHQLDLTGSPPACFQYVCSDGYELDSTTSVPTCVRHTCSDGYELNLAGSTPMCTYVECPDGQHRFGGEPVSSCHDNHEVPSPCSGTYAKHSVTNTHQDAPCPTRIECAISSGYWLFVF